MIDILFNIGGKMANNNYNKLLEEYRENRKKIKSMIEKMDSHVSKVESLIPKDDNDYRKHSYIFEQKIKLITEFMKLIFDMRKEISKSIKDEITLLEKIKDEDKQNDDFDILKIMAELDKKMNQITEDYENIKEEVNS